MEIFEPKVTDKAAFVAIWHNGELLVLQSRKWQTEGTPYLLPGGGCKEGEDQRDCAKRETLEETGFLVDRDSIVFEGTHETEWSNCSFYEYEIRPTDDPLIILEKKLFGYEWWNFEKDRTRIEALKPFMMPGLKWYLEQKGLL